MLVSTFSKATWKFSLVAVGASWKPVLEKVPAMSSSQISNHFLSWVQDLPEDWRSLSLPRERATQTLKATNNSSSTMTAPTRPPTKTLQSTANSQRGPETQYVSVEKQRQVGPLFCRKHCPWLQSMVPFTPGVQLVTQRSLLSSTKGK